MTGEVALDSVGPGAAGIFYATGATILDNVISTRRRDGHPPARQHVIQGNLIGTNKEGNAAIGNDTGIRVDSGSVNNTIGGTAAGQGNVISGNGDGILIRVRRLRARRDLAGQPLRDRRHRLGPARE